tara:strand:- start:8052 stop:8321 length:270 start_codon:yes stop_codon:yes gene_type:complete
MPFYDYTCEFCGYKFEKSLTIARRHEPRAWTCPKCHEPECFVLQIGAPGFADPVQLGIRKPQKDVINRINEIKKNQGHMAGDSLKNFRW